jgi:hypothetical protein
MICTFGGDDCLTRCDVVLSVDGKLGKCRMSAGRLCQLILSATDCTALG